MYFHTTIFIALHSILGASACVYTYVQHLFNTTQQEQQAQIDYLLYKVRTLEKQLAETRGLLEHHKELNTKLEDFISSNYDIITAD